MIIESFIWNRQFVTGIEEVDQQHKSLVDLVNRFGASVAANDLHVSAIEEIFQELAVYARTHFDDEEKLMTASKVDPRHLESHIAEHNSFLEDVLTIKAGIKEGEPDSGRPLLEYLIHWLAYHILGADQHMARQLEAIARGSSPALAFDNEVTNNVNATEPLVRALNGLFSLVSRRSRELLELNRTLERKVAERTAELSKANTNLEMVALTDDLTNLPNRRHAIRKLTSFWAEASHFGWPLSCLMIDADGFKGVNDTYGHDAGDEVLRRLAMELRHSVRTDDLVCRLGGDEFLALCPNTDLPGALILAEQIREIVSHLQVMAGAGYWHGSVSIGVATMAATMQGIDDLLKAADEGVYLAKRDGRNCVRTSAGGDFSEAA